MLIDLYTETDFIEPEDKAGALAEIFLNIHGQRIENIKNLFGRLPTEGEILFLWTVNSFNAFTFIPYIIRYCGDVHEVVMSTYSINIRIIDALIRLVDSCKIHSIHIFISDSIKSRLPKVYDHLMAVIVNKPISVDFAWNHSKITLIKTVDGHYVVEGSGNWGENAKHEQYIFLNSRNIYEFRKNEILYAIERRSI